MLGKQLNKRNRNATERETKNIVRQRNAEGKTLKACKEGYKTIGIGVVLYKDYGPAQKLYFKMGYRPDGNGLTYKGKWVIPGEQYPVDDDLLIWLAKQIA